MKTRIRSLIPAWAAALALSGCASLPGTDPDTTPDRSSTPSYVVADELSFSVSGEVQPNNDQQSQPLNPEGGSTWFL